MAQPAEKVPRVVVFDSGVGGLSVLDALQRQLPGHQYYFVSDNAGFPYGTRSEYSLTQRVHKVLRQIMPHLQPDLLVVACNSASTVVLPSLRESYETPLVGVVPAIKPAAALSKTGVIGLLATPATVQREYTHRLVREFAPNCRVEMHGSGELVEIAERAIRGVAPGPMQMQQALQPLIDRCSEEVDTLVLACTHFPLIKQWIEPYFPSVQHWVEPADAIARRVESLLGKGQPGLTERPLAILTQADGDLDALQAYLRKLGFGPVEVREIDAAH